MFKEGCIILAGAVIALPLASQGIADIAQWSVPAPKVYESPIDRYQAIETHLADLLEQRQALWQSRDGDSYMRQQRRSERLKRLLGASVDVLAANTAMQARQSLSDLDSSIRSRQTELAQLRAKAANTPTSPCDDSQRSLLQTVSCSVMPSGQAVVMADIERNERQLAELENERSRQLGALAQGLREIGIELTSSDLNGLLLLVSADRLIEAYAAYEGLMQVNAALIRAAEATQGDIEVLKRYYGFHVALVEVALHLHETFLDELEGQWIPRLSALRNEAIAARFDSERLLKSEKDEGLRRRLTANLSANALSIEAADLYGDHLRAQEREVAARWSELHRQHRIAVNTYRTVAIQGDILAVMRQTDDGFAELMRLELPPLRSFASDQLRTAVGQISEKLRLSAVSR
ncbi:hypothetical protein [Azospirillum sp. SYSU D00513]|uniref:hypothetical protein n=1 Tax=Azospirillum sp. SYSU D00513 TaxID=2812561 RepID=UPI001A96FC49|nr:hypothetical protein [Azospirillum sp. SYSU D00513]